MEKRRMISALLAGVAAFYLYLLIVKIVAPPKPQKPTATQQAPDEGTTTSPSTVPATDGMDTRPAIQSDAKLTVSGGESSEPVVLGGAAADSLFPMELTLHPRGAAVGLARIRGHYDTVERQEPYHIIEPVTPDDSGPGAGRPESFVTLCRFVDYEFDAPLDDALWSVESASQSEVVFSVDVETPQGQKIATIRKTYALKPQPVDAMTYDLSLSLSVENLTAEPLTVEFTQRGAMGFSKEDMRRDYRKIVYAEWDGDSLDLEPMERKDVIKKGGVRDLGGDTSQALVAWVAEGNKYFACVMRPAGRKGADGDIRFARVEAATLSVVEAEQTQQRQDLFYRYETTPIRVQPGASSAVDFDCYLGPKSRTAFKQVEQYENLGFYQLISNEFLWCAPGALVEVMMGLLNLFHKIPPYNYGLAIIMLVVIVRLGLHPLTKKSQVSMMQMQKNASRLQPKLRALREKYGNDKAKLNQATMQLYKEEGVNPAGQMLSCLPMMLQIPIWGALWTALAYTIEMRHAPFDGYWIRDLTRPDAVISWSQGITIPFLSAVMGGPITSLNILPMLLGVSQLLQARFMPRGTPGMTAEMGEDKVAQQRKMMIFMSVFFVFILYNAPSGLTLYIMVSNFVGVFEQWRVRKHLRELEERGEDPTQQSKQSEPGKPTWLERKWKELQKQAEEAQRIQSDRKKDKGKGKGGR